MESLKISFNILVPIFLMTFSGILLRKTNVVDEQAARKINALAFKFFLPVMTFYNVYQSSLSILRPKLTLFIIVSITAAFGLAFVLVPLLEKRNDRKGVIIQGIVRSNFAVYGYAVASAFCAKEESGLAAVMAAIVLPLYAVFSTIALSLYGNGEKKADARKILSSIAKNPLVIAGVLGIMVLIIDIKFPSVIDSTLNSVSKAATPVSLVGLGSFLSFKTFKGKLRSIVVGTLGKLVILPMIFITAAVLMGFRGADLAVITAVFASPTATASFAMTQQMSGDDDLAAALVVTSCLFSFATMFVVIFLLHSTGLF